MKMGVGAPNEGAPKPTLGRKVAVQRLKAAHAIIRQFDFFAGAGIDKQSFSPASETP
jgi:hypothetical protein